MFHAQRLINEEDKVTIAESERLSKFFKFYIGWATFSQKNSTKLVGAFKTNTWVKDFASVKTLFEVLLGFEILSLSHHDHALVQK